ncbi:MAG: HAD-IA family hydrolase [Hyphomonas sp.]|nr:HAD-IA family hydrolase [Hyphomonas sp.]
MTLKLAIWDMDGTIVDSRDVIQRAMTRAFEQVGLTPPQYDDTRKIVGLGLFEACEILAPPDISTERLTGLVDSYKNAFRVLRTEPDFHEPLYDGAMDALTELRDAGWLIGMATGKSRYGVRSVLDAHGLDHFFDTIWCADDGPGKPHPFMVEQAMGAMGVEAPQAVMIGDAIHDIAMGRAAGVRTLGVSWGFGAAHELEQAGADEIHHDFGTLRASLFAFTSR